jgi:choline dehydrogenase
MGGRSLRDIFAAPHGFVASVNLGAPYSRGEIRLRSADPNERPLILPNHFGDPRDMATMVKAIQRVRHIAFGASLRKVIASETAPGVGDDVHLIEQSIREKSGTYAHQAGTCAMGPYESSVLDSQLRLRGVSGLRVVDTSIMPRVINANLHAPALMIGEKGAAMIMTGN